MREKNNALKLNLSMHVTLLQHFRLRNFPGRRQDFVANFSMNFGRVSSTRYMCAQRLLRQSDVCIRFFFNSLETGSYLLHYFCCIGVTRYLHLVSINANFQFSKEDVPQQCQFFFTHLLLEIRGIRKTKVNGRIKSRRSKQPRQHHEHNLHRANKFLACG